MVKRRVLAVLIAAVALSMSATAQDPLITVQWEADVFGPNPTGQTTLYDDGTVSTTVNGAPDPDDWQLPESLIPPGASSAGTVDIGIISGGEDGVTSAVAAEIGAYLIGEWLDYAIGELRAALKELNLPENGGSDFNQMVVDKIILYLHEHS